MTELLILHETPTWNWFSLCDFLYWCDFQVKRCLDINITLKSENLLFASTYNNNCLDRIEMTVSIIGSC